MILWVTTVSIYHFINHGYLYISSELRSWDNEASGCDINEELAAMAAAAPSGEDGPNGE